jgi:hypothetical protein
MQVIFLTYFLYLDKGTTYRMLLVLLDQNLLKFLLTFEILKLLNPRHICFTSNNSKCVSCLHEINALHLTIHNVLDVYMK